MALISQCYTRLFIWLFLRGCFATSDPVNYKWKTDAWAACKHSTCGHGGVQSRIIWCSQVLTNGPYPPENCDPATKPTGDRPCFRVCDFHKYQYAWHESPWEPCRPRDGRRHCEEDYGIQTRNITCRTKCGFPGTLAPVDDVCEHFVPQPISSRVCKLPCRQNCIMTEFGEWSQCNNCWVKSRSRYRTILQPPSYGGSNCTDLSQNQPCQLERECFEHRHTNFQLKIGNWTQCFSFHGNKGKRKVQGFTSVLGHRRRNVDCINIQGDLVDKQFCSHLDIPKTMQLCVLPRDCLVSHWTNWTSFGQSLPLEKDKILTRQRNVLQVPRGLGETCPMLTDNRPAQEEDMRHECHKYMWMEGSWSECRVQIAEDTCGAGVQNRTLLCVRTSDLVPVPDPHCTHAAPDHSRVCEIPCPQNCMVSHWSSWSSCLPHQCKLGRGHIDDGYRVRSRSVLRPWAHGGEKECPHLNESQPCTYPACYTWRSEMAPTCDLKYPEMKCGEGTRKTYSDCVSLTGDEVSPSLCFDSRPATRVPCHVACADDCVTSEWTEWTSCHSTCGGRAAGFRSRKRDIIAKPGPSGAACPSSRMLAERERCSESACTTFHWDTTGWGRCELNDQRATCGEGTRHREVACFKDEKERVAMKRCPQEESPVVVTNCTVPCPIDCVLSLFTDWSACAQTCIPDKGPPPEQQRLRYVMTPALHGGKACGALYESRTCTELPRCLTYRWRLSEWSHCMYATHYEKCGPGYRAREVRCINSKEEYLPEEICISQLGSMPDSTQYCYVKCDQKQCKFSEWSEWSGCSDRCSGHRTRRRAMEGMTNRIAECYEQKDYVLEEKELCRCPSLMPHPIDRWSSCILDTPDVPEMRLQQKSGVAKLSLGSGYCGVGRRHQALLCKDSRGTHNASAAVCQSPDFVEEMCFVPCPQDCLMSSWSAWTDCRTDGRCGNGQQTRSRYMIEMHLDGGRQCPKLTDGEEYQSQPCSVLCGAYVWKSDDWSSCNTLVSMSRGDECGAGLQSRIVRCLHAPDDGSDPLEVSESLCDLFTKPKEVNYCQVPCPGHCVVSEWTGWANCSNRCNAGSYRERSRVVVRQPASTPGEDTATTTSSKCLNLRERESCELGVNCFLHDWRWSNWGACVMDDDMPCGTGRRKRFRECLRNDGVPVPALMCSIASQPSAPDPSRLPAPSQVEEEAPCTVDCPVDCQVAKWTQWSECSHTCGLGYQSRSRSVVIHAEHGGRNCPLPTFQERPCSYVECFRWELSDWNPCQMEHGSCGFGVQQKNLTCRRHDGTLMDKSLCPEQAISHFKMERHCFRPCPCDCHMSEWSEWGLCHRPCTPGFPEGIQTRSRALLEEASSRAASSERTCLPCPEGGLWETRPCEGGPCPVYSWHTTYWENDNRKAWCQRSDGLKVMGGCKLETKPSILRSCNPPCVVEHSFCRDTNVCACVAGYVEVYERTYVVDHNVGGGGKAVGKLQACTPYTSKHVNLSSAVIGVGGSSPGVENQALYHPHGTQTVWLYVVVTAGCAFILFIIAAILILCKYSRRERRRRNGRPPIRRPSDSKCSQDINGSSPLVSRQRRTSIPQTDIS